MQYSSKITQFVFIASLFLLLAFSSERMTTGSTLQTLDIQGHRGARGEFPELTMKAFEAAVSAGVQTLELDLHFTKDKRFVLFHDHQIQQQNAKWNPRKNLEGRYIYQLTSAEIRTIDVGSWRNPKFPHQQPIGETSPLFLEEWLDTIQQLAAHDSSWKNIRFNMEIKVAENSPNLEHLNEIIDRLIQILNDHRIEERTCIQSFHLPIIPLVRQKSDRILTAALFSTTKMEGFFMKLGFNGKRNEILKKSIELKAHILSPHYVYCNKFFIKKCHKAGLKVIPWTVNEESLVHKLTELGVDGIITDYPTRTIATLKESRQQT